MEKPDTLHHLKKEIEDLRLQLDEANDTIEAIRSGQVDALIIKDTNGHQLYTLKSADQAYRVFIEKMKEGAVTLNRNSLILYSNSRFANMVNLPLPEVIGAPFGDFVHEKYKDVFFSLIENGWQAESKGEICLATAGGNELPILISLTTLELDEGIALSVIITDLTKLKETENQLKQKNKELLQMQYSLAKLNNELEDRVALRTRELLLSREHFKFLADNIPVMVWTAKPNGDLDYYNKRWFEYTDTTFEETKEWGWKKVIHPDDLENTIDAWTHSIKTGNDYHVEYRFLRASDNTYRWYYGNAIPFKKENGEIVAWFGICTDIEDQKIAMTRKDEFISMASHELKTPVTILKAYAEVLISNFQKDNNEEAETFMIRMDKQINKLSSLVSDLLDASKVNAGMMLYEKEYFDFNEMVTEVVDQIQLTSETHHIDFQLCGSNKIFGDRNRLSQVISNLISNAIKYSPHADRIIVSSKKLKNCLRLGVQDFGIGIPAGQQSKLFSRFFRASEVKTNTFPGLGLGLFISNEIIKRHSGSLTFDSEEGKGSTFYFELPLPS